MKTKSEFDFNRYLNDLISYKPVCELVIPTGDASIIERWANILFEKGVTSDTHYSEIIELCNRIVLESNTTFKKADLTKLFETKLIAEFERPASTDSGLLVDFRQMTAELFLLLLVQDRLVSSTVLFKIWNIAAVRIELIMHLTNLLKWIKVAEMYGIKAEDKNSSKYISDVMKALTVHLSNDMVPRDFHQEIIGALKYLKSLIESIKPQETTTKRSSNPQAGAVPKEIA